MRNYKLGQSTRTQRKGENRLAAPEEERGAAAPTGRKGRLSTRLKIVAKNKLTPKERCGGSWEKKGKKKTQCDAGKSLSQERKKKKRKR